MRVKIGYFGRPHGLRGELKLILTCTLDWQPKAGSDIEIVTHTGASDHWKLKSSRKHQDFFLITLESIDSREQAEILTNCPVFIEISKIPEHIFFIKDLVGSTVTTTEGKHVGTLVEVISSKANDLYRVINNERELLVPAIKQVVKQFDKEKKLLIVELPEGLEQTGTWRKKEI